MICMCRNHNSAICKTVVTGRVHRRAARWQRDSGRKVERESVFKNMSRTGRQSGPASEPNQVRNTAAVECCDQHCLDRIGPRLSSKCKMNVD